MIFHKYLSFFYNSIVSFLILNFCSIVYSADYYSVTGNPTYEGASYSVFGYLIKMIFYLAILSAGLYYLLKYIVPRLKSIPRQGGQIEVVDFRALTPSTSCQLVKVGTRYFLLGVSGTQVNLIQELKANEISRGVAVDAAANASPSEPLANLGASFNEILKKLIKK